jgi:hypothetical protein
MKALRAIASAAFLAVFASVASAQTAHDVEVTIEPVTTFSVTATTVSIDATAPGTFHGFSSYSFTSNEAGPQTIKAQITSGAAVSAGVIATGVTLSVTVAAPSIGTSDNEVLLTTTAATSVVHGITTGATVTNAQIDYKVVTTAGAAPATLTRTITYTVQ